MLFKLTNCINKICGAHHSVTKGKLSSTFVSQSPQYSNSTDSSYFDGPPRLDSVDGDSPPPIASLLRQFYESPLGALAIGLAAGSLAVFIALRIYKVSKS